MMAPGGRRARLRGSWAEGTRSCAGAGSHITLPTPRTKEEVEQEVLVEGNLVTEANLIVLDTLEIIAQVLGTGP